MGQNKGKIVYADDNKNLCKVVALALKKAGYGVRTVNNGFSLIKYLKKNQDVDAVILDLMMPEKDGLSIFETIRSISPASRIIIYTGYPRYAHSIYSKEADAFIEKTEGVEKMISTLKEIL